ncbi:hypothetical protein PHLCEN_2v9 [Hermanssonia centrifuga]|uniref:DUF6535 domain-containing protein n=1 Tax=Hermanssonia centrifuga TaxID=98765 RepID=A0A2R6S7H0_9APHY|nr:hypothetical protein PHLCEN_2v9 [Hermanssonia centrifuga]
MNTRFSAVGMPVGWAAIAKTVRDIDEDKIRNCKEDIDTLLVFAGLFSAVLTAFLVESYQTLSEDQGATMIQLLRQISSQTHSYAITAILLNSTAPPLPTDATPFEPPLFAIRVNVLWFASLIFSLITASFGMLVKQWLREFLSGDYTSPKARLRVRQFRFPGLLDWKVFEIAAVLPLLLQLALGLFLLGLCFFTWEVHPSIGLTSTPLVAGWALLFASCTIAPAFSSRCPYQFALLKRAMKSLRRLLCSNTHLGWLYAGPRGVIKFATPFEDADAATDEKSDVEMLAAVDAILLDDDLLGTTMWESLQQNETKLSDTIRFILGALRRRLSQRFSPSSMPRLLDLRQLTKQGWEAVVNVTAQSLIYSVESGHSKNRDWINWAIAILLSHSEYPLTIIGRNALVASFQESLVSTCNSIAVVSHHEHGTNLNESFTHLFERLGGALGLLKPEAVTHSIFTIVRQHLELCRTTCFHRIPSLADVLFHHSDSTLARETISPILLKCLDQNLSNPGEDVWTFGTCTEILAALDAILLDDALLVTKIWPSLKQNRISPSEIVEFVVGSLRRRAPFASISNRSPQILSLHSLAQSAWIGMIDIVADLVNSRSAKHVRFESNSDSILVAEEDWEVHAFTLLLSKSDYPLTSDGVRALESLFEQMRKTVVGGTSVVKPSSVLPPNPSLTYITQVFRKLRETFPSSDPECMMQHIIAITKFHPICTVSCNHHSFGDVLWSHSSQLPVDDMLHILMDCVIEHFPDSEDSMWTPWAEEIFDMVYLLHDLLSDPDAMNLKLRSAIQRSLPQTHLIRPMMVIAANRTMQVRSAHIFSWIYDECDTPNRLLLLGNLSFLVKGLTAVQEDAEVIDSSLPGPLAMCHFTLHVLDDLSDAHGFLEHWKNLWVDLSIALKCFRPTVQGSSEEHHKIAAACLSWIEYLEDWMDSKEWFLDQDMYKLWLERYKPEKSFFPEELIEALGMFIPNTSKITNCKRLKRLRDLDLQDTTNDSQIEWDYWYRYPGRATAPYPQPAEIRQTASLMNWLKPWRRSNSTVVIAAV